MGGLVFFNSRDLVSVFSGRGRGVLMKSAGDLQVLVMILGLVQMVFLEAAGLVL